MRPAVRDEVLGVAANFAQSHRAFKTPSQRAIITLAVSLVLFVGLLVCAPVQHADAATATISGTKYTYSLTSNKKGVKITQVYSARKLMPKVPATINGKPVVEIALKLNSLKDPYNDGQPLNVGRISGLDLSNCTKLKKLDCMRYNFGAIKLPSTKTLEYVRVFSCKLRELDVSKCPNLSHLEIAWNLLKEIDTTKCPKVKLANVDSYQGTNTRLVELGWRHDSIGWYYRCKNGTFATGLKKIGTETYFFDSDGNMKVGWQKIKGEWYLFNASGAMVKGWAKSGGKWYYMNSKGVMQTGFKKIGKVTYYLNKSGAMLTGWQKIAGSRYYFASSGAMKTSWMTLKGKKYYFASDGKMLTGTQTIKGKKYVFSNSGVLKR